MIDKSYPCATLAQQKGQQRAGHVAQRRPVQVAVPEGYRHRRPSSGRRFETQVALATPGGSGKQRQSQADVPGGARRGLRERASAVWASIPHPVVLHGRSSAYRHRESSLISNPTSVAPASSAFSSTSRMCSESSRISVHHDGGGRAAHQGGAPTSHLSAFPGPQLGLRHDFQQRHACLAGQRRTVLILG